jgi:hypothetical protein
MRISGPGSSDSTRKTTSTSRAKKVDAAPKPSRTAATRSAKTTSGPKRRATVAKAKAKFGEDVAAGKAKKATTRRSSKVKTDKKTGLTTFARSKTTSTKDGGTTRSLKHETESVYDKKRKLREKTESDTATRKNADGSSLTSKTGRSKHDITTVKKEGEFDDGTLSGSVTRESKRGSSIDRSRERQAAGGRSVADVEKDAKGTTIKSFKLSDSAVGKNVKGWTDGFNDRNNIGLEIPKGKGTILGGTGRDQHMLSQSGSIELGTRLDTPDAELKITTKGVAVTAKAGGSIGLRGEYGLKYKSPEGTVAGVRLRNDTEVKVSGFVGAELKGDVGLKVAPLQGQLVASAGGEAFIGAKVSGDASTSLSRMVNGKKVELASVKGTAEGWAGAGLSGSAKLGFDKGKISYKLEGGVALGLGGKLGLSGELDVYETAKAAGSMVLHANPVLNVAVKALEAGDVNTAMREGQRFASGVMDRAGDGIHSAASGVGKAAHAVKEKVQFWKGW